MQDETLKQSFLTATLMLMGAISRNEGAHSYEFSQTSELLECLVVRTRPWQRPSLRPVPHSHCWRAWGRVSRAR